MVGGEFKRLGFVRLPKEDHTRHRIEPPKDEATPRRHHVVNFASQPACKRVPQHPSYALIIQRQNPISVSGGTVRPSGQDIRQGLTPL